MTYNNGLWPHPHRNFCFRDDLAIPMTSWARDTFLVSAASACQNWTNWSWGNCLNPFSVQHEPWQTYKNIHAQGPTTSPKFIRLDLEGAESFRIWPCLTDLLRIVLIVFCFGLEGIFRILQPIAHTQQIGHFVRLQLLARRQGKAMSQFVQRTNEMCSVVGLSLSIHAANPRTRPG